MVICPSNPFLSVDPILAVDGVRQALAGVKVPVVVVSPLIGGKALKGPLSKLLEELGFEGSNRAIAAHYAGLLDHIVIDRCDADDAGDLQKQGLGVTITGTLMKTCEDQARLARTVLTIFDEE